MADNVHLGHRGRMKRKLIDFSPIVFDTYELLEMLLYYTVRLKDTNPISKALLSKFGSLSGVFSASEEKILEAEGVGEKTAKLLILLHELFSILKSKSTNSSKALTLSELGGLAAELLEKESDYTTVMLSLDNGTRLLGVDKVYSSDCARANVRPAAFLDIALRRGASRIVIAHNHPFGPLLPSEGDRETTKLLTSSLLEYRVGVLEHFVTVGKKYVGFISGIRGESKDTYSHIATDNRYHNIIKKLLLHAKGNDTDARRLTEQLPSPELLCCADYHSLSQILPSEAAILLTLSIALCARQITDGFKPGRKYTEEEFFELLFGMFLGYSNECVFGIFLDSEGRLIKWEKISDGVINGSSIFPRKLVDLSIRYHAKNIIIAHNHPGGNSTPSEDDIRATEDLSKILDGAGIKLKSHYAVSGREITQIMQ